MDWNLFVASLSLGFAPITVWLARKQIKLEKVKETSYSISIELRQSEQLDLLVKHNGISPLHRFSVWVKNGEKHQLLHESPKFESGDALEAPGLEQYPDEVLVTWFVPRRSGKGLQSQALRVRYHSGQHNRVEEWKYYWWTPLRLSLRTRLRRWSYLKLEETPTKAPLGYWKARPHGVDRPGGRPGWPNQPQ
ncbi:hypothetical protein HMPREF1287_01182 [Corynebacterium sp. KPL1986]|nr:hypothetical protein HMPREF1293_02011 [Corynebacterium sp. KPL1996]ERS44688.1 hypothetical protein HMPREF1287_01182 [Corynebacterium sp. KPL1986]ERS72613.1 hypothetical protein HMPREF1295_01541 [Corynebacterium sp. KPL1998]ERS73928.1 hypothetical protein HMPREF1300_00910 [Corynebacterium sp. KPL2004]